MFPQATLIFHVNISYTNFHIFHLLYIKLQYFTPLKHFLYTVCNCIYRYILTDTTFIMFFLILFNHLMSLDFLFLRANMQSFNNNSYNLSMRIKIQYMLLLKTIFMLNTIILIEVLNTMKAALLTSHMLSNLIKNDTGRILNWDGVLHVKLSEIVENYYSFIIPESFKYVYHSLSCLWMYKGANWMYELCMFSQVQSHMHVCMCLPKCVATSKAIKN